ncbi:MAG: hypothetical protein KAS32_25270 [Candidatus Peribacteraceae bacterium]|nr:hypothetical protein [Candidatus Peribacteraceae bacterium]
MIKNNKDFSLVGLIIEIFVVCMLVSFLWPETASQIKHKVQEELQTQTHIESTETPATPKEAPKKPTIKF